MKSQNYTSKRHGVVLRRNRQIRRLQLVSWFDSAVFEPLCFLVKLKLETDKLSSEPWPKPLFYSFYPNIRLPQTLPRYFCGHSFHFCRWPRTTIHFRSACANMSIVEMRNAARDAFRIPRRFRKPWFSDRPLPRKLARSFHPVGFHFREVILV